MTEKNRSEKAGRRQRREGGDARQLTLDWAGVSTAPPPVRTQAPEAPAVSAAMPPPPSPADPLDLAQLLPWDFQTTFPPVLEDAIDAGVIDAEDALPENLAGLHEEHGAALRAALVDADAARDARRRGVDPATGRAPRSQAKKRELPARLDREVQRLERWWETLLDTYAVAFGDDAADAFGKFVRARHAGVPIVTAPRPMFSSVAATLPTPAPLRSSVASGVFGQDEDGPVDPDAQEVLEITERHAEVLIDLAEAFRSAGQSPTAGSIAGEMQRAVENYASDFGQPAADDLLAYCRRRALLNTSSPHRLPYRP